MSQPKEVFAAMLSTLSSVQAFLGADDAAESLASIHVDTLPRPADRDEGYTLAELTAKRPFMLVSQGQMQKTLVSHVVYSGTLEIVVTAERNPLDGYDATQAAFDAATIAWDDAIDAIEAEILSTAPNLITIFSLTGSKGWAPSELHHDEGEFQGAEWTFTVGL